mmetsp:Transcript_225/g.284  ORF Transcript_225/g.284 Transcript_225/m.284 type:complete len:148 (+) Transcript_225:2353-2796(+)
MQSMGLNFKWNSHRSRIDGLRMKRLQRGGVGLDSPQGLQQMGQVAIMVLQPQMRPREIGRIFSNPPSERVMRAQPPQLGHHVSSGVAERHVMHPRLQAGREVVLELASLQQNHRPRSGCSIWVRLFSINNLWHRNSPSKLAKRPDSA